MYRYLLWLLLFGSPHILPAQTEEAADNKVKVEIGGALRFNYNYSSWKPNQRKRGGDLGFEVFRLTVDASRKKWSFKLDQRFYAAGFGGAFLKFGWFQYALKEDANFKFGLLPAYFGAQQFNSHSWFFQLPFYLGFEDDHDMGISYSVDKVDYQLDIGFYKNAETLTFADNAPISDARYAYDFSGRNKEINQLNVRYNHKLGAAKDQKLGGTLQVGGIWNIDTESVGLQRAVGLHYETTFERWNVQAQFIDYDNRPQNAPGENRDAIEMTAYGFPYQTAARARLYSAGVAYTLPVKWGPVTALQFYDDYSYMDKAVVTWEDTQMNVLGILVSAHPVFIYVDWAAGLHQPWLGPQWADALTTGERSNGWESRFNVNFGYYF